MFDKLEDLLIRYEEIMGELQEPDVVNDQNRFRKLMKEQNDLTPIVEAYKEYKSCKQNIEDSLLMLEEESDEEMKELAKEEELILLCGHYEGIDERVLNEVVTDYISIGDYVLTGGELPAMVLIDTVSRFVDGVLSNDESAMTESFSEGLLEYPQYSRPYEWHGKKVPDILMSGHHENVEKWRFEQSLIRTEERRPDLYKKYVETHEKDKKGRYIR